MNLQPGIVYGPVTSRRLGRSLGVNILPEGTKHCNFNCPYCQYGWTPAASRRAGATAWPDADLVGAALAAALQRDPAVDRITLAGNGEPTLHPAFPAIVERVCRVRDALAAPARVVILSNSSTLDRAEIVTALRRLDERHMKLDAGDSETLRRLNGSPVPVEGIVEALSRLQGVVLQAMFARGGAIDNTSPAALGAWLDAVRRIRPLAVHLYTLARDPAWQKLEPVPQAELGQIARQVEGAGVPAVVF